MIWLFPTNRCGNEVFDKTCLELNIITSVLLSFNFRKLSLIQSLMSFIKLVIAWYVSSTDVVFKGFNPRYSYVSSAYKWKDSLWVLAIVPTGMIVNNIGPRTDTTDKLLLQGLVLFTNTHWNRLARYEENNRRAFPLTLMKDSNLVSITWSMNSDTRW